MRRAKEIMGRDGGEKGNIRGLALPDIKTYCKTMIIIVFLKKKQQHGIGRQINGIKSTELNSNT